MAIGALQLAGCGGSPTSPSATITEATNTTTATTTTPTTTATCSRINEETAGPYPGDGSNGPNVLTSTGVVRSDIRSSFAGMTGTAQGVPGRWPHIHFEVYPSLSASSSERNKVATSQIALPKAANDLVYAVAGYEASIRNAAQVTLASDNVFSDGSALEQNQLDTVAPAR